MARVKKGSVSKKLVTHPTLTGESFTDMQLWWLSFILADIAARTTKQVTENIYPTCREGKINVLVLEILPYDLLLIAKN